MNVVGFYENFKNAVQVDNTTTGCNDQTQAALVEMNPWSNRNQMMRKNVMKIR